MNRQLIIDFQFDDTHLELIPTLDLMTKSESNLFYQILLWPSPTRRWALVRFRTRREDQMTRLIAELGYCFNEGYEVTVDRLTQMVTVG